MASELISFFPSCALRLCCLGPRNKKKRACQRSFGQEIGPNLTHYGRHLEKPAFVWSYTVSSLYPLCSNVLDDNLMFYSI